MTPLMTLGQVCEQIVYGVTAAAVDTPTGPRLLRITDIKDNEVDWKRAPGCSITPQEYSKSKLRHGDIVVARTGGTVGKSYLVSNPPDAVCASYLLRLRPDQSTVLPEYLQLFLRSPGYWKQLLAGAQGAAQPNVNGTTLSKIELPVPTLPEQASLVAALCKQLAPVNAIRSASRDQLADCASLAQTLKQEATVRLNGTERVQISDLLVAIEAGKSIQTTERPAADAEIGVLKVSAVSWGQFRSTEAKAVLPGYNPDPSHRVRAGDVLISRANTVELVGAVVRVDGDHPNRLLSDKTLRLVLNEQKCDPSFVVQALRLPEARAHIQENATGTSSSMRNISQDAIRTTPIPLPPLVQQRHFAQHLMKLGREVTKLQEAIDLQLSEADQLTGKLLAHAFRI
jgi:type I restriction enzyme S subunit